jgi:hypothetical protein
MGEIITWKGRCVRLKREYIKRGKINMTNGFEGAVYGEYLESPSEAVFNVQADFYGVDLFWQKESVDASKLPEPTHQIIIKETGYPYMWEAKYFELINE